MASAGGGMIMREDVFGVAFEGRFSCVLSGLV